ncbi:MAG: Gfo/Idh/MocA family oxidoreductase [bacterium]
MLEEKLKVGIAGYGIVGNRRRYFIDKHPRLRTVAVCDQIFKTPQQLDEGIRAFPHYRQLLDVPMDVLFVSLPNYLAAEVTMAGLEKGLHVFCEKPPGRTVSDIKNVIDVENKHPELTLKYGFNHRYHDSVRKALSILESGDLGEIVNLRGVYGKSSLVPFVGEWRAERKYSGGGILLDQGIHMVDLMCLFCEEFADVKSFISNSYWNFDVEDNAYAIMRDLKGRVAVLHSTATQWQHRFNLDIALTRGFLQLNGILSSSKSYGQETLKIGHKDEANIGTTREETITFLEDNSWGDEVNEFADSIINGKDIKYGSSQDALRSMKLVYKIYYADSEWREKYSIENPNGLT